MKQSKRYKVIKEILGGVTHDVVYKVGDTVNENIFNGMLTGFLIANGFLEPLPETPPMEIVEGYSDTGYYLTLKKQGGINDVESILIRNPTPEMKQIIEAAKGGEVVSRWVDKETIEKSNYSGKIMFSTSGKNLHKILIIPIEEENNG